MGPGGSSALVLGGDYPNDAQSSNKFANGANQNAGNVLTDRPSTRLHHAPGGKSTLCLGDGSEVQQATVAPETKLRKPLAEQNGQPHRSQFGASSLVLGGEYPDDIIEAKKVSSNAFANGANQNAGNTITDRPTTRLHHAPGGKSTICLGDGGASEHIVSGKVSSNKFACGAHQNAGNFLTDKSSTRIHQAPGGKSSICLGDSGNENVDTTNVNQVEAESAFPVKTGDMQPVDVAPSAVLS